MDHEPESLEVQETTPSSLEVVNQDQGTSENQASIAEVVAEQNQSPKASSEVMLAARLTQIETTLFDLKQMFEQRLQSDRAKEKAFDALYVKLEQQESRFQASLKENLIRSLLLLYDSMVIAKADLKSVHPSAAERIGSLKQELLNILYSEDVEPVGELETLNRQCQKVSGTILTDDSTQHHSIVNIDREGFIFQGRVLRPQSVVIRQYQPTAAYVPQPENPETAGGSSWPL